MVLRLAPRCACQDRLHPIGPGDGRYLVVADAAEVEATDVPCRTVRDLPTEGPLEPLSSLWVLSTYGAALWRIASWLAPADGGSRSAR